MNRVLRNYFIENDTLSIAKGLIGKTLVRDFGNGEILKSKIIETEAYIGEQDLACHASKGKTERNKIMYEDGGLVYVYLIYGLYWMLNFVTEKADRPEAVLIRGIEDCSGPGRIGRLLKLDRSFYGENLETSTRIWIEDSITRSKIIATPRIGIDYSGEIWKNKPWRFVAEK